MAEHRIEPLADRHERGAFSCGSPPLDLFLRTQAGQYARKGVGRTYVAVEPDSPRVLGYYTLAASSIPFEHLPRDVSKRLPRHPVPTVLLGRLAVDVSVQRGGLGKVLLADAARRVLGVADQIGVVAVHVHAIDEAAQAWYLKYGFRPMLDLDRHLFLAVETLRREFGV